VRQSGCSPDAVDGARPGRPGAADNHRGRRQGHDRHRYGHRAGDRARGEAARAMQEDANRRITVEGYTCNIGTTEYTLALGERRATAVRDYLVGRGINANRLQTARYGDARPTHDNGREETRRLNR